MGFGSNVIKMCLHLSTKRGHILKHMFKSSGRPRALKHDRGTPKSMQGYFLDR